MVLIWYATESRENNNVAINPELIESLIKMEKQLDEAVK